MSTRQKAKQFFSKATTKQAKMKLGIYGDTGSGKTYTALEIASKLGKIAVIDTEHSSDFYSVKYDFDVIHTRSLKTVLDILNSGELSNYGVLIVDSITHLWEDAQDSYLKALETSPKPRDRERAKNGQLEFQDWKYIKRPYKHMIAKLLALPMHVIICGRQGMEYKMEAGQLSVVGVKMKAESETPYEPAVLIRMELKNGKNVASVEKDRSNTIMGKTFEYPTFEMIKPILAKLGKKHDIKEEEEGQSAELYQNEMAEEEKKQPTNNKKDPLLSELAKPKQLEIIKATDELIEHIAAAAESDPETIKKELLQEWFNTDSRKNLTVNQCRELYTNLKSRLVEVQNATV